MPSSSDDEQILEILDRLTAKVQVGEPVDLASVIADHPDMADEIRSLWATIAVAEQFGLPPLEDDPEESLAQDTEAAETFAGKRIGDYELIEEIGRGGMGVVYRARQVGLDRMVAVKMLLNGALATGTNLSRFRAEAQAAARLDHPHLVTVHDVGEEGGLPYFSMEWIDGGTLAHRIADGPLPNRTAAELLVPVCRAIDSAHQQGILHRDLKPSNILMDSDGRPYVSDFGLAKQTASADGDHTALTQSGAILGTPGFMAPEQAAGRGVTVGPAADVYSLGAILYACLTGRPPFQAATPVDVILLILEQDPPPPRVLNPKIDLDLEMIILKAIQKPIDLRYSSAGALADDLEAYLGHEPVSARSSQFSQVLSRAFRPTHHIGVLENWGLLWMWHAVVLLVLCLTTNWMKLAVVQTRWPYVALWTVGLGAWATIFWNLRRRTGPVTFVERQIAHVWAASMASSTGLFAVEALLGLPVLTLSPVLGLIAGTVFVAKAGILSGEFYVHAVLLYLSAIPMAIWPDYSLTIFGIASALTFFLPGWKFFRLQRANRRMARDFG